MCSLRRPLVTDTPSCHIPHHLVQDKPTYLALSGATQTGPNTFWTLSALAYARNTGNLTWLRNYMPTLRAAAGYCFQLIDPIKALLKAPGSLMIDVFIRDNFTSDSNAMVVGFLNEFAEAEDALGNTTGAAALRQLSTRVAAAVNSNLWADERAGADHYITQLNPDGSTRDFVDYDANLIAIAHGVANASRAERIFERIDRGRCSAASGGGPQFVSEVWYGPSDTTHGNVSDSRCSGVCGLHARAHHGALSSLQVTWATRGARWRASPSSMRAHADGSARARAWRRSTRRSRSLGMSCCAGRRPRGCTSASAAMDSSSSIARKR